jgi:spermidine synthase
MANYQQEEKSNIFLSYVGIFLTSLSVIILEISFTKIFSVTLWYHFAFFLVSLALFGIGAGGLAAFFLQDYLKPNLHLALVRLGIAQFGSVILCLVVILNCDLRLELSPLSILLFMVVLLLCSIPFMLAGLIIALMIRRYAERVPKLYFSDLIGAAVGCVVFIFIISLFSGPTVVIISGLLAIAAAASFSLDNSESRSMRALLIAVMLAVGTLYLNNTTSLFSVKYTKSHKEESSILFEKWSPLSRITVYPYLFWDKDNRSPFGWGMSKRFEWGQEIEQLFIEQDASAGTPITRFDGDLTKLEFLKYDITSFPYHVKPESTVFIVGAGGGRDVLTALSFGCPSIFACDIHPVIINLVKEEYRDFAGNLYALPQVKVEVAEARNYIRNSTERFDIIQISLIDSWAATVAGAFSLSENSLYTVEAFSDYFTRLNEDGILAISRWLFWPRSESLKVAILARKTLESMGTREPEKNIAVIGTSKGIGMATVLAKTVPFSKNEIRAILDAADRLAFEFLYLHGHPGDATFGSAMTTRPLEKFLEASRYDLRPTTDDRPFFFQMVHFKDALGFISENRWDRLRFHYYAPIVLLTLLFISSVLILVFYAIPLVCSKRVQFLPGYWAIYFALLGLGFMLVEIPMIQKGSLYLGHPTFGLSVVLFSMLIFAGLGSYFSGRVSASKLFRMVFYSLVSTAIVVVFMAYSLEWVIPNTISFSLGSRTAIMILITGFMAVLMGIAFPSGIRLIGRFHENAIPWSWALNGGASVLGSILAMTVSMCLGYRMALILGAGTYLLASFVIFRMAQSRQLS